jgi:predicted acetyltransferase
MPVELMPASLEEQPVLANLIELYAHDFSEILPLRLGDDGRFGYDELPLYWAEENRFPFLVRDGSLAGFVLVKRGSELSGDEDVWDMAEMFVARGHRRRGVATQVAHEVWRRFPGAWEVRVMQANVAAIPFWAHAVAGFLGREVAPFRFERPGKAWMVFSFDSGGH